MEVLGKWDTLNINKRLSNLENVAHEPQDYKEKCEKLEKRIIELEKKVRNLFGKLCSCLNE